jgi:hypothetical protein
MPVSSSVRWTPNALLTAALLLLPTAAAAQEYPIDELGDVEAVPDPSAEPLVEYGGAMASNGQTIAVGSPGTDGQRGRVDVMDRSGLAFQLVSSLAPATLPTRAGFGTALAMDGDTLAVGAPNPHYPSSSPGAVWVYVRSGGTLVLEQVLTPSTGLLGDQFGRSVALVGDRLVVGAPYDDDQGAQSGTAFVFERAAGVWTESAVLLADDGAPGDQFGRAVAVQGDTIVVGAWLSDAAEQDAGAAYVFVVADHVNWAQQTQLLDETEPLPSEHMGESVAIDGEHALVGAPRDDTLADDTGVVHHFTRDGDTWAQTAIIQEQGLTPGGRFGCALSSAGTLLLVGAPASGFNNKGRAVLLERDGDGNYSQVQALETFSVPDGSFFGTSVAAGTSHLLFGSPTADGAAAGGGALLNVPVTLSGNWIDVGKALAGTNGEATLSATGTIIMDEPYEFSLSNGLPSTPVFLILGLSELCVPLKGGFLVPAPDFTIIGLATDAGGDMVLAGDWPTGFPGPWEAYFQVWWVDGGGAQGFAASNGLQAQVPPG